MQLRGDDWGSLTGKWDFAMDTESKYETPGTVNSDRKINVPFAPESPLSGVNKTGLFKTVWYRRTIEITPNASGRRLLLHFGVVDYEATVWVTDRLAVRPEGGYTPSSPGLTDLLTLGGPQTIF